MAGVKYTIKKRKTADDDSSFWKEIGVCVIDAEEGKGVMYLHHLDGEFRLFSDAFYEKRAAETGVEYNSKPKRER